MWRTFFDHSRFSVDARAEQLGRLVRANPWHLDKVLNKKPENDGCEKTPWRKHNAQNAGDLDGVMRAQPPVGCLINFEIRARGEPPHLVAAYRGLRLQNSGLPWSEFGWKWLATRPTARLRSSSFLTVA